MTAVDMAAWGASGAVRGSSARGIHRAGAAAPPRHARLARAGCATWSSASPAQAAALTRLHFSAYSGHLAERLGIVRCVSGPGLSETALPA